MSDDPNDRRDGSGATTSFEEWLDQHAESQGVSRQELFERLVSSYWTLNEMVRLLDDSGSDASVRDVYPGGDDGSLGAAPRIGGGSDASEESERPRRRDRPERGEPRERADGAAEADSGRTGREGRRGRVAALRDRLDDVEDRLDDQRERGQSRDRALEAAADRLSEIEADVEALAAESEAAHESLADDYGSLADRIDDLETDVDGRHKQLADEQKRLRSRLDAEFEDLETILEYLVARSDDFDAELSAVEERYDDERSRLRWEREALRSLLADAAGHDVHAGACEACGERVDLGLLADPYCPACDALLTGVDERDKWLFLSDVVVTADEGRRRGTGGAPPGAAGSADGAAVPDPDSDPAAPTDRAGGPEPTDGHEPRQAPPTGGSDSAEPAARSTESDAPDSAGPEPTEAPTDPDPVDFGRVTAESDANTPEVDDASKPGDAAESAFTFDDPGSEPETGGGAGDDAEPAADADAPFGDLDDLKREEERNDDR
jgi:archaellum component FlaC